MSTSPDYTEGYADGRSGATIHHATNDDYRAGFRDGSAAREAEAAPVDRD